MPDSTVSRGLEDVLAGTSAISTVDGIQGKLTYQGYDIRDLVASSTFEETTYLLWRGSLPKRSELDAFQSGLNAARTLPPEFLALVRGFPCTAHPMAILRTAVSALSFYDSNLEDHSPENSLRISTRLVARTASIVAAIARLCNRQEPVAPRADLGFAANFLYMMTGKAPDKLSARVMDEALIMHADHEFNASTFTARVIISTWSDLYSAMVGAIGALKGPSHGGANQDVMRLLEAIGEPAKADQEIKKRLAAKQRIPGFGHRVYKTWDPRALLLKKRSQELAKQSGDTKWYDISDQIEKTVFSEKKLYPNVDFYSASTYHYLGVPENMFPPVFAVSRMTGWTAHAMEQYADNRLIRPRAEYTGPVDLAYVPIDKR
jgi:citrate synthase